MSALHLIDSHCHLQDAKFDDDRAEVVARALAELDAVVVIGDDLPSSEAALALVRPGVHAVVGVHPYHAKDLDAAALDALRALALRPGVVGIGETGLDYYNEYSPRPAQRSAFVAQLALAAELSLPVVIHNREADADTLSILKEHASAVPSVIMHCFGSNAACAEQCLELGCHISFAGNLTFPKAEPLRDAARITPLDRLLVETDAPYLAPQPMRGKRCEPQFVRHTAERLAEVKGVGAEDLFAHTTANARRIYGLA